MTLLISIVSVAGASTTAASPIEDGERRSESGPSDVTFFSAPPSCPSFPALSGSTPDLLHTIAGWYGPSSVAFPTFEVRLTARVSGTAVDRAGNVFRVHGHFAERGQRDRFLDFQVRFRGEGALTITGPAGTYIGRATARILDGPPETQLAFTEMAACHSR